MLQSTFACWYIKQYRHPLGNFLSFIWLEKCIIFATFLDICGFVFFSSNREVAVGTTQSFFLKTVQKCIKLGLNEFLST